MKVCKLVRLTQKDSNGFIESKEGIITVRGKVVVSEETVKESEENYQSTGLLYKVDKKKTEARDKELEAESAANIANINVNDEEEVDATDDSEAKL